MTTLTQTDQLLAEFETHLEAERAIRDLNQAGIPFENISIIGRDYQSQDQPIGYITMGDRVIAWSKLGAFWGGIWGILYGSAMIVIPGVGPVVFAGWLVTTLAGIAEGAFLGAGLGTVGAALASIGVKRESAIAYDSAVKAGKFILVMRGTREEVGRAKTELDKSRATFIQMSAHQPNGVLVA
jgi:hypothetical protein